MKFPKRSQYKYAKYPYRIRNWPEYESGLRKRGDRTIWFSNDAINSWRALPSGKPGGQRTYAIFAIEATLTILMVFHLPLGQLEGFLRSRAIGLSTCSSTARVSGFTSAIFGSHRGKGHSGTSCEGAHPTWTRRTAKSKTVGGTEGEESKHPLHP